MDVGLFTHITSRGTRATCLKLLQGKFRLDTRKHFFTKRIVRHVIRLPTQVMESPSLNVFKRHADVANRDMV